MRPLCLYREQERALRCRPIAWLHTTAGLGSPMGAGRQSCPPVAIHICVLTGAPWRRRPGHCPPATSTDCPAASDGGEGHGDSLARCPGTDQPLCSPGRAPSEALSGHFATFGARHHRLCRSSAGGDGVPASAGNSVRDRPAIDPPAFAPLPVIQL